MTRTDRNSPHPAARLRRTVRPCAPFAALAALAGALVVAAGAHAAPALVTAPDTLPAPPSLPPARPLPPGTKAAGALAAPGPAVTEVKVESIKPKKTRHETLRFLKDNKDFLRARLDLLRATSTERGEKAGEIDPRFLNYQRLMRESLAAGDSVASAEAERQGLALLESVSALARLEGEMDLLDSLLAGQRERLLSLQNDFAGRQRTALLILLAGYPRAASLTDLDVTLEDGTTVRVAISEEQRESLRQGGIAQIFYGLVEPRDQIIEVTVKGDAWPGGNRGYLQIDPKIDRVTLLKLDASGVDAARGAPSLRASAWLHEDRPTAVATGSPAP